MIITNHYYLERGKNADFFYVRNQDSPQCPVCQNNLKPYGRRMRKITCLDGEVLNLKIRRLKCVFCGIIHHEFPNRIIPYKRYEAAAIERIVCEEQERMEADGSGSAPGKAPDYPCEHSTAMRLRTWFVSLLFCVEINTDVCSSLLESLKIESLTITSLKNLPCGWLQKLYHGLPPEILCNLSISTRIA